MSEQASAHRLQIHIDREHFTVESQSLTGAQIRALPSPPIGPERDLYEEVPGPQDDRRIADDDTVQLRNGMHFFTAPGTIAPG
jgi:Multiubiquitin